MGNAITVPLLMGHLDRRSYRYSWQQLSSIYVMPWPGASLFHSFYNCLLLQPSAFREDDMLFLRIHVRCKQVLLHIHTQILRSFKNEFVLEESRVYFHVQVNMQP